jgi:folate-dependent phosphoribosylglycinamide formyltransferase PurN
MATQSPMQKQAHTPTLKTIQMIETILAKQKEFSSRNKLSRALPKQVQPKTIDVVLSYLEKSKR